MQAVVFHDIGDIRLEEVPEPRLQEPHDAIVRITTSAICGTDLHAIRGTSRGMKAGTILGHEGVGIVEEVAENVRNFAPGDRVVIASTVACGYCVYCRAGYFSQCDTVSPKGHLGSGVHFGGPESSGALPGLQAEQARIPYAHIGMVKLPDTVTDDQAILISDIFPTGYFGAKLAEIKPGNIVAVFGCGPVGLFAILSAQLLGAGRVLAVDQCEDRLERARDLGAETIHFEKECPVEAIRALTGGIGADRVIDAVGVEAHHAEHGPAAKEAAEKKQHFADEVAAIAPEQHPQGALWRPGNAPSQVLEWMVKAVAKAGTLSIIGSYPQAAQVFPVGEAFHKNLTIRMGICNHRKYIPYLVQLTASGAVDPCCILPKNQPLLSAIDAYKSFDLRRPGWIKTTLTSAG